MHQKRQQKFRPKQRPAPTLGQYIPILGASEALGNSQNIDIYGFMNKIRTIISDKKYVPLSMASAREITEQIKDIATPLNIKVTYENAMCLTKIEKIRKLFMQSMETQLSKSSEETTETAEKMDEMDKINLMWTKTSKTSKKPLRFDGIESPNQIVNRFRVLLSTNRYKANFQIPLVQQANGIVFEIAEIPVEGATENTTELQCNLLAMPPKDFNPNFRHASIDEAIRSDKYDVYEIKDGTTVNIYYDQHALYSTFDLATGDKVYTVGKWVRSTKNAFDIDEMIWRGSTYGSIINDVLAGYPEWKPEKSLVYSIGFKHPAFHPFGQPSEYPKPDITNWVKYAWLIQIFDISQASTLTLLESSCLPVQERLKDIKSWAQMRNRAQNAAQEFLSGNTRNPFLGYLLRSKSKNDPDIILESDLWNLIRHSIYQMPFILNKTAREKQEHNFKNMNHVIIESYLDFRKKETFFRLFPQFISKKETLDRIVQEVVAGIYQILSEKNSDRKIQNTKYTDKQVDLLIIRFLPIISEIYHPALKNEKADKKTLQSLLMHPKYTNIYLSILDL